MAFKSILDPKFRYTSSASTDVRKTFERIKRQQQRLQKASEQEAAPTSKVVGVIGPTQRKSA